MTKKPTIWKRMGLQDWFLKKEPETAAADIATLTPDDVFKYIADKFKESISQLSFANRVVFFHEYIICFNAEDFRQFMDNRKGIFGLIVQESVKHFYQILQHYRQQGKTVEPSSNKWVFRFVSHPDYNRGDKSFIGKLMPGKPQEKAKEENLRVTFIPRQTGIAENLDVNQDLLNAFTFYSDGYYEVAYQDTLAGGAVSAPAKEQAALARFEAIIPEREYSGKKIEFLMRGDEIVVSGKEEKEEGAHIFKIPSDWINSPHLRIRYHAPAGKFYVASFGEKTILNEHEITNSAADKPHWVELPVNSRMVLNGIVGINIFKS